MFDKDVMQEIENAARGLGVEPAALAAVAHIESGLRTHAMVAGRAEPLIRFEGHYFDRRLSSARREKARREGLSAPQAGRIANPAAQTGRWALLARAAAIDHVAAHESVSWGIGQVMGAHWAWLGYASVDALVAEARTGIGGQMRLMARYIEKAGLAGTLQAKDWATFARFYNGPAYRKNDYDGKLARAYERYARRAGGAVAAATALRRGARGEAVRNLQSALSKHGYPVAIDGLFGPRTQRALQAFQSQNGLTVDGVAGPATMAALARQTAPQEAEALPASSGLLIRFLKRLSAATAPAPQSGAQDDGQASEALLEQPLSKSIEAERGMATGQGGQKTQALLEIMTAQPVIPVLKIDRAEQAAPLARALARGGLPAIEITLRTPIALDAIRRIADEAPEAVVGAGTILDADQFAQAEAAGARFIVSPGTTAELIEAAAASPVPLLPGAVTPSEIMAAAASGYTVLKFFPAEQAGGIAFLKALASPLAGIRFCPTGGIDAATAPRYLALGNVICVGGSWVAPDRLIAEERWDEIEALAREAAGLSG